MRQIKASAVKPGMTIRWDDGYGVQEITPSKVVPLDMRTLPATILEGDCGVWRATDSDRLVTVLSEPAEPQPEEPVTLCARIVVAGRKIYRWTEDPKEPWPWRGEALNVDPVLWSWGQLCGLGPVTVVDAAPSWTAPEQTHDTPEVPNTVHVWPENDTALRPYPWRDRDGGTWKWLTTASEWECYDESGYYLQSGGRPFYGPWTRVTDA